MSAEWMFRLGERIWKPPHFPLHKRKEEANAAHFHACWLFWVLKFSSIAISFLFCAFSLVSLDRNGLERSSELWSPLVISQVWLCTCSHLWRDRQQPPIAPLPLHDREGPEPGVVTVLAVALWPCWPALHGRAHGCVCVEKYESIQPRNATLSPLISSWNSSLLVLISICKHYPICLCPHLPTTPLSTDKEE